MRPYPAYKDSDVEWLGEVPEGWGLKPLKHVADFENGAAFKPETWSEEGIPIIRIENLNGGEQFNCYAGDMNPRFLVAKGDILFGWSGNRGTSFGPFIWPHSGSYYLNQHIFNVRNFDCDRKWFYWCLKAVTYYVEQKAHGIIGMVHITKGDLGEINIPQPSPTEQQAIARFLDKEVAKIDALVAEQRRLIALLAEKRQAVISHAVTKGLNPSTPLKPSGIDWLGDIPEGWEVVPLKHLSPAISVGVVVNPSNYVAEEGLPFIYGGDISEGVIAYEKARRISAADSSELAKSQLRAGDLLTVRVGAPGVTAVVGPEGEGGNCASVMLIRRGKHPSQWLCYAMNSRHVRFQVEIVQYGAAQEQFNISHAVDFRIVTPPVEEAQAISNFLDAQTTQLDTLTTTAQSAISLLQERRAALISAAVTGKIDLRAHFAQTLSEPEIA